LRVIYLFTQLTFTNPINIDVLALDLCGYLLLIYSLINFRAGLKNGEIFFSYHERLNSIIEMLDKAALFMHFGK
jgi:hypothetical protein